MKTLNEYLDLPYRIEVIPDTAEGGYVASYPELPGCITCGGTVAEAIANAIDAKREWLAAAIEDGVKIPLPDAAENYSGQFKLRLPKSLHKQLAEEAKRDGISMNQYCVYLLSQNNALHSRDN
ncbi:MAG: toxin-antitoxin system HicB family antitoxin [Oscillospiraceae bacterium]